MKKPSATNPLLKIGQAAKALGVSIDTLRRWEKAGKISTIRTPGGTRLYSLAALRKINPSASWRIADFQAKSFSTEELLKRAGLASEDKTIETVIARSEATWQSSAEDPSLIAQDDRLRGFKQTLLIKLLIGSAVLLSITLLLTSWITASYLTNPKETQQFFKNNVAQGLLTPFHKLAEVAVAEISPEKAQELGFSKTSEVSLSTSDVAMGKVLAVTSVPKFLEVNSDTQINGSLSVRDSINNLTVEATPSASTLALTSGDTTLTVTKNALLDQDVSTTATPIFNTLNLSATKDQLVFQSGGPSGTLTWTPTAIRTITLPDTTTTLVGTDATQTLTNKSMSGSSNTFTSIPNSALSNPKVTVTAGTNLTGGGDVSLGSSITLSLISSPAISGVLKLADGTAAAPALTFTNDTNTGLYRIGTDKIGLITGGSATSGITIDGSGNVGVGTITPSYQLQTTGNVGLGGSLTVTSATSLNSSVSLTGLGAGSGNALCVNSSNAVVTCTVGSGGISGSGFSGGVSFFDSTSSITATPNLYWDNTNSRLGIGTSSPDYSFKVNGTGFFSGFVGIGSSMNVSGNVGIGGSLTVTGLSSLSSVTASSLTTAAFKLTTGAGNNYILVSDESGSGSWSGTISGSLITDNSLDFDKFKDNMTLDASTDIATAGYNLTTSGIGAVAFNNTGTFTVAGAATFNSTINTNTFTSTALVFSGSGNVGISATVASTNLNLNPGAGGSVNLAGGSGSTGCTIDDTTGSLTCSGSIGVGSSGGQNGLWSRDGTTLSPAYTGDSISTSGNISAIGNGAITSGGVLTAQNGLTLSTGALSLTSTSGTAALNLSLVTNAFTVNGNTFGIDVFNSRVGIGTSSPIAQLDIRNTSSGTNLHTYIGSSAGQFGILDNGNVGIGTTNPGSSLQVSGNGIFGWGTTSIAGPSNGLGISGNVGIGTTTTLAPLHVQGNGTNSALFLNGNVGIGFTSPDRLLQIGSDINITSSVSSLLGANGSQFAITGSTASNLQKKLTLGIDTTDNYGVIQTGNTSGTAYNLLLNPAGGNVGIGTTVMSSTSGTINVQVGTTTDNDAEYYDYTPSFSTTSTGAGFRRGSVGSYNSVQRFTGITIPSGAIITASYITFTAQATYSGTTRTGRIRAELAAAPTTFSTLADYTGRTRTTNYVDWPVGSSVTLDVEYNSPSLNTVIQELVNAYSYSNSPIVIFADMVETSQDVDMYAYSYDASTTKAPKLHIEYTTTTTLPGTTLGVSGNALIGAPFFGAAAPANGLAVQGNVGIGTTTANSNLSIAGNAHIGSLYQGTVAPANGLFVDGNVGIGATTSSNKLDVWGNSRLAGTLTVDSTSIFGGNLTLSSGQFLAPNGSASLPSYSFTNSTSTGMYSPSVNALSLVTNGASTPALTITAGGNVGIGTTVPGSTLSVIGNVGIGTSAAGATLQVNGGGLFGWGTVSVAGPTNGLAVFGNVGIGTTTANSNLSVVGNAHVGGLYQSISAPTNGLFVDGNVGIGATTSSNKLDVWGNQRITGTLTVDQTASFGGNFTLSSGQFLAPNGTASLPSYSFSNLTNAGLWTNGNGLLLTTGGSNTSGITVTGAGNVGIGLTNPAYKLDVNGDINIPTGSQYKINGVDQAFDKWTAGTGNDIYRLLGNVGIGFTNPDRKIQIGSDINITPTVASLLGANGSQFSITGSTAANLQKKLTLGIDTTDNYGVIQAGNTDGTGYTLSLNPGGGNVGIGFSSPAATLDVIGTSMLRGTGGILGLTVTSSGNVGIGTTGPGEKLTVDGEFLIDAFANSGSSEYAAQHGLFFRTDFSPNGSSGSTEANRRNLSITVGSGTGGVNGDALEINSYQHFSIFTGGANERLRIDSSGNVGIGTTTPSAKLDIEGSSPVLEINQTNNGGVGQISLIKSSATKDQVLQLLFYEDTTLTGGLRYWGSGNSAYGRLPASAGMVDLFTRSSNLSIAAEGSNEIRFHTGGALDAASQRMVIDSAGNVGIGNSVPAASLFSLTNNAVCSKANAGDTAFTACSSRTIKENIIPVSGDGILDKIANVPVNTYDFINGDKNKMGLIAEDFYTVFNRGDNLSVNGQEVQMATWLGIQQLYQKVQNLQSGLSVNGGNVGIGTSVPTTTLDVVGHANISGSVKTPLLDLGPATIASSSTGLAVQFTSDAVAGVPTIFQIKNSLGQNLFSIDASGSAKLAGTITTEAGAFDVAEDYSVADQNIEAGDVVSLSSVIPRSEATSESLLTKIATATPDGGPRNDESAVEKSSKPYDNSIIGIISTKPGIHLSAKTSEVSQSTSEVGTNQTRPVALNGRVPVKVSTENGAINAGDYLTSSSTPGVAMKATRPGQVIGKALEAFPTDTSEVKKCDYTSEVDCGKIVVFINISFADPGNFLASLSLDDQGNMIIPKIRTSSLLLDPSVASASSQQLTANSQQLALDTDPNYTSPGPSLATGSNQYIDLSGKIASLEDRIAALESVIASEQSERGNLAENEIATSSATPRDDIAEEASSSASLATSYQLPATDLNLTPPDILLATGSATLANLKVTSEATVSGMLTAYQTQIQDNFKVLGKTTLADTLIAGELMVDGILSLTGSSLSTLGPLYIQNSSLAQGVDIFNGKVTIDPGGNITTQGKIIATEVKTNKLTISNTPVASSSATLAASIGTATLPNGSSAVTIDSAEISDSAKVFITPTSPTDKILSVVNIKPGENFDVATLTPAQADIKFNWWIVESR